MRSTVMLDLSFKESATSSKVPEHLVTLIVAYFILCSA